MFAECIVAAVEQVEYEIMGDEELEPYYASLKKRADQASKGSFVLIGPYPGWITST